MTSAGAHIAFKRGGRTTSRGVLFSQTAEPLTLLGTAVDVETHWTHARVKVRQEYRSDAPISVSAFAAFNLVDEWQVLSFRCEVGHQVAYSQTVPKPPGEVKCTVDRHQPRDDLITAQIPYSIHAGQSVLCTIIYLCPLEYPGADKLQFSMTNSLTPEAALEKTSDWKKAFTVPHETRLPNRVLFTATGNLYSAAESAPTVARYTKATSNKKSNPKQFEISLEDRGPTLALPEPVAFNIALIPDEDPVNVQVVKETSEHVSNADRYALAVSLTPQFAADQKPNIEVVLAIDQSLSMAPYAAAVRATAKSIAAGLPLSCFVNVLTFGAQTKWLYPEGGEQVNAQSSAAVLDFIDHYEPQESKTKILQAVREVYHQPTIEGYARVVLLITDGSESKHTGDILHIINANAHSTRVVAVALGEAADRGMLQRAAKVSNGVYCDVNTTTGIYGNVVTAVSHTLVPTLSHVDLRFVYDGVDEEPPVRRCYIHPALVPQGHRAMFYGLGSEDLRGCTCLATGNCGGTHIQHKVHTGDITQVDKVDSTAGDANTASIAHQAAATLRIRTLVDRAPNSVLTEEESGEVARLGIEFSVPTPLTKLQLSDGSSTAIDPTCKMISAEYQYERQSFILDAPIPTRNSLGAAVEQDAPVALKTQLAVKARVSSLAATQCDEGVARTISLGIVSDIVGQICDPVTVDRVLTAQQADGSWTKDNTSVMAALGKSSDEIFAAKPIDVSENTWITALVMRMLSTQYSSDETSLAQNKARAFLSTQADSSLAQEAATA